MINFLRIVGNIRLGNYLHLDGTIDTTPSNDIIGVCVIPSNFLPDGFARFISLGASHCRWGRIVKLRSDFKRKLPGKMGEIVNWGYIKNVGDMLLANPYLPDDYSLNSEFLQDLPGGNAFQDYKGYENMRIFKEKYGGNKRLFNAFTETIKNSPSYRKDDWYLPAIGELAFIIPRFKFIRDKINGALIASSKGIIFPTGYLWSSSEWNSRYAWYIDTINNCVDNSGKGDYYYVRPFLSL